GHARDALICGWGLGRRRDWGDCLRSPQIHLGKEQRKKNPNLAERYRKHLNKIQAEDVPIDIKPVNPPDVFCLEPQEPKQLFWVRARGYIGETDMKVHCCVAAYISDYAFLGTALLPHRQYHIKFLVSLDHSMWFHAPFRADHWMLYECESPWAGEAGLGRGPSRWEPGKGEEAAPTSG
uniref:Acyl-CoA thioesterase 8 n=1 Tax=Buteo japonicus TaxID=224669 RepID=A0A8B9Z9H1_9AVES